MSDPSPDTDERVDDLELCGTLQLIRRSSNCDI